MTTHHSLPMFCVRLPLCFVYASYDVMYNNFYQAKSNAVAVQVLQDINLTKCTLDCCKPLYVRAGLSTCERVV